MELILIRHGEPAWVVDGQSQMDPALTERGQAQAERVAQRLSRSSRPFDELICSSALRAKQTAAPIHQALALTPLVVDDLTEIKLPDWRGTSPDQVRKAFVSAKARPLEGWWEGMPGGESFTDFHARVTRSITSLLKDRGIERNDQCSPHGWSIKTKSEGKRIIFVGHGGTNGVLLGHLLGVDPAPWEWERFALGHTSIAKLRAVSMGGCHVFSLRGSNDLEHLTSDLRSS